MGFFKNLLGITTEEDWPDMVKYNAYFTDTLTFFRMLEKDYSGKTPRAVRSFIAVVLSFCQNNSPEITLSDMPMGVFDRIVVLLFKATQYGKLCNDPIEKIAMYSALCFCNWNMKSSVVADRLANMSRGAYGEILRLDSEYGIEKCYCEAYAKNGFTDIGKINSMIDLVAERCERLGILSV